MSDHVIILRQPESKDKSEIRIKMLKERERTTVNFREFVLKETGMDRNEMSHDDFYTRIINLLGYEEVKKIIPFSYEQIKDAYKKDVNLNNLSYTKWTYFAGFRRDKGFVEKWNVRYLDNPIRDLYHAHGITSYSPAEGVCLLKRCAEMWLEEKGDLA